MQIQNAEAQTEESTTTAPTEEAAPQEQEAQPEEAEPTEAEAKADDAESTDEEKLEEKAPEQTPEQAAEAKHKRMGGWQRKAAQLERQNAQLIAALEARGQSATQPPAPAKEKTDAEKAEEWVESVVAKRLAQKEAEQQRAQAQAEFRKRAAEVRDAHPDFDEVLEAADAPVSPALAEALLTSEHGPAIMYELAKSPAELARINALPPLVAAREIGRLEAKRASSTAAPKTQPRSATRPPAPPTSVSGSPSSTRSLDDLPISEYKRALRSKR